MDLPSKFMDLYNQYLQAKKTKAETKKIEIETQELVAPVGHVPRIVPVRYEKERRGLFIANDGEPAYEISIQNVPLDSLTIKFINTFARLVNADGKKFCEVWIQRSPHDEIGGGSLYDKMVEKSRESLEFRIRYRGENPPRWYESVCTVRRNVEVPGGLEVFYIRQEKITLPAGKKGRKIRLPASE